MTHCVRCPTFCYGFISTSALVINQQWFSMGFDQQKLMTSSHISTDTCTTIMLVKSTWARVPVSIIPSSNNSLIILVRMSLKLDWNDGQGHTCRWAQLMLWGGIRLVRWRDPQGIWIIALVECLPKLRVCLLIQSGTASFGVCKAIRSWFWYWEWNSILHSLV